MPKFKFKNNYFFKFKNKYNNISFILYFDEKCPLCLKSKEIIYKWINPKNTIYVPLSNSNLKKEQKEKALEYILLKDSLGNNYWGYYTYCKLLTISTKPYSFLFIILSKIMRIFFIKRLGLKIYKLISDNRKRCDETCYL